MRSSNTDGAVKLLESSGVFFKGDEKNEKLQRIYGTAFATQAELDQYERLLAAGDNDIFDWVSGQADIPPEADTPVLRKLLAFRVRF